MLSFRTTNIFLMLLVCLTSNNLTKFEQKFSYFALIWTYRVNDSKLIKKVFHFCESRMAKAKWVKERAFYILVELIKGWNK